MEVLDIPRNGRWNPEGIPVWPDTMISTFTNLCVHAARVCCKLLFQLTALALLVFFKCIKGDLYSFKGARRVCCFAGGIERRCR